MVQLIMWDYQFQHSAEYAILHQSASKEKVVIKVVPYQTYVLDDFPPGIEPGPLQLQCAPYTKGILWAVIQSPPLEFKSFSY